MGSKESKQPCISYEDAVKRVSESELRRLKDAFKRSAGVGRVHLTRNAFHQDVLCEGVPPNIAELLYNACGGNSKGISFKDLLCGLVLLTRGKEDEQTKFLWNLYCNESSTYILKSVYVNAAKSDSFDDDSLFAQTDRVTYDHFHNWILEHRNSTVISKWLLSDSSIRLTSDLESPTFYQSLAGVTHLEEKDIGDLEKEFWHLKNSSPNGQLDLHFLGPLISPPIQKNALAGFFNAFDENRDGHIDFKELCCGVSAACRGPIVERTRFCFKIFDIDCDGILNQIEILQMITILLFVAKENCHSLLYKDVTRQGAIKDLSAFASKKGRTPISDKEEGDLLNFSITAEDFMMWSVESSQQLVKPFLDLTFEVCHIVFGLWPQCRHLESDIVRGWLQREEKRKYRVGQFWYLISQKWWLKWIQYTQNIERLCDFCKKLPSPRSLNFGVDEALVCDESLNSSSLYALDQTISTIDHYSISSTNSCTSIERHYGQRPGPIDNSDLIIPNPVKNVRILTGEGGHLKCDTPLMQYRDFELVPKMLWKAFNRWYGDNIPLPRQVIQPPNSSKVELELFPINLHILLHQNNPNNVQLNNWGAMSGGFGVMASGGGYATISATNILHPPKRYLAYTAAFSRLATVHQIGEFLCEHLQLKVENIRLWHIPTKMFNNSAILLEEDDLSLQELQIKNNDEILLEIRNKDLTWPEELGSLTLSQAIAAGDRRQTRSSGISVHISGATGLHNLGNTCFINAALQVLFNTQPLAQYFCRNMHLFEINASNKLGTRGQLAIRYGELLKETWNATTRSVAPLKLRFCVTKNAPQFAGGGQHDSQEFLEWFLDTLHEDLNRVTEKPYSELKDSEGRPDEIVAAEAWTQHGARNQSVVIDLFYGQLKSKVCCLSCGGESVRFDPFNLLSLPLPVENYIYFEVLVILLDGSVPTKYGLRMNSESKYVDLKQNLCSLCCLNPNGLLICEIWNSQIKEILFDEQKIKPSTAKDLYAYQIPAERKDCQGSSSIFVAHIEKGLKDIQRNPGLAIGQGSLTPHTTIDVKQLQTEPCNDRTNPSSAEETYYLKNTDITDDVEGDDNNQVTTKQPAHIRHNAENTFTSAASKLKASCNLLRNEYNFRQTSLTNHSGEHSTESYSIYPTLDSSVSLSECNVDSLYLTPEKPKIENNIMCDTISSQQEGAEELLGIDSREPQQNIIRSNYLVAVHRKITRHDSYFLSHHKTRPSLFGIPLLIPNLDGCTHKDLYCAVWLQVSRLLSPLPVSMDQVNHAADCDDSLGYDFPFTLRVVKSDGLTCALCPWSNFCRGCEIPCNNEHLLEWILLTQHPNINYSCTVMSNLVVKIESECPKPSVDFIIAIDWDPTALHLRYQSSLERLWVDHETVARCRNERIEPVDLMHCFREFTQEEKLEQWYHCSQCKGKKPATKKLQIWKLPPILIVHLKRFNCVKGKWVKSQKVVHFPFDEFDPTPYLAAVPQETILRYKELYALREAEMTSEQSESKIEKKLSDIEECEIQFSRCSSSGIKEENKGIVDNSALLNNHFLEKNTNIFENCGDELTQYVRENLTINNGEKENSTQDDSKNSNNSKFNLEKRKRLISTSLTRTPIIDGDFQDFHSHKLKNGEDKFDPKYKLYAVVAHSGMLNGGHYISYAANSNGSWYCYNDSSCREISSPPNIDASSAYLLFYERKGLDYESYLPNIEGKSFRSVETTSGVEDSENDLKKLCSLS